MKAVSRGAPINLFLDSKSTALRAEQRALIDINSSKKGKGRGPVRRAPLLKIIKRMDLEALTPRRMPVSS